MDPEEEDDAGPPPPPPGWGGRGGGGGLQVDKHEWEAIEAVPPAVRRVGALFQAAARELTAARADFPKGGEAPPESAAPQLPRTRSSASADSVASSAASQASSFDREAWAVVAGEASAAAPQPAAKKKGEQLRRKRLEESLRDDLRRLEEDRREDRPPKLERYGNRFESFLGAALAWLERKRRPRVLAAVTALRLRDFADRRYGPGALPEGARRRLDGLVDGRGADPSRALAELCQSEEQLAGAPLLPQELALHQDQRDFAELVCAACRAGAPPLLLRYQTPPSGGKTSATALLSACLQSQKRSHVIYCCYSRPVRIDVCKHLLAASVPFAIVVQGVASPHNSCFHGRPGAGAAAGPPPPEPAKRAAWSLSLLRRCDRFPVALICDLASSLLLLQQPGGRHVLLFDEPTADVAPGMQAEVRRLLRRCPAVTVLMSASVPPFEAMPAFVQLFRQRHPDAELKTVACDRLPMSITALDASGAVWAPHHLGATAEQIRADGHLLRFYSPRVLAQLARQAPEGEGVRFEDLLSYAAVRAACLRLLPAEGLARPRDDRADEVLRLPLLCTSQAWRLPGASLVILDAARSFLTEALAPNLQDAPSLRRVLKAEGRSQRPKRPGREAAEAAGDDAEEAVAQELWPRCCLVNSAEHLRKHAPPALVAEGPSPAQWLRASLPLPPAVRDLSGTDVVEAALCGVLPFGLGDALYEATAQSLAEQALESFAVADKQLIYGLNFPVERVVVATGAPLSYLEMKQLCGRAGRTGRSAKAEVLFLDAAALRAALLPPSDAGALLVEAASNFAV